MAEEGWLERMVRIAKNGIVIGVNFNKYSLIWQVKKMRNF